MFEIQAQHHAQADVSNEVRRRLEEIDEGNEETQPLHTAVKTEGNQVCPLRSTILAGFIPNAL